MKDRMDSLYGKGSNQSSQYQRQRDLVESAMNGGDGLTTRQIWALDHTLQKRKLVYDQIAAENKELGIGEGNSGLLQENGETSTRTYRGVQYTQPSLS